MIRDTGTIVALVVKRVQPIWMAGSPSLAQSDYLARYSDVAKVLLEIGCGGAEILLLKVPAVNISGGRSPSAGYHLAGQDSLESGWLL